MSRLASQRVAVLIDAGPLVALINGTDKHHAQAVETLKALPKTSLLATWPGFTEAIYLLGRSSGYKAQTELLELVQSGAVRLWNPAEDQADALIARIAELMATYRDTPCDLADATLIAVAELEGIRRVFTFDRHFHAYRTRANDALEVLP